MSRPLRYTARFPDQPTVGYHSTLGREARSWAIYTASQFGGWVEEEFVDGTSDVIKDFRGRARRDKTISSEGEAKRDENCV